MSSKSFTRGLAAFLSVALVSSFASAAVFDPPSPSSSTQLITGAAPSGITWAAVASGTALPIRSTGTQNGLPGAVAYFNVSTGLVQLDPRGWDISLFNITYTSGTTNTSGTTPGPLVYSSGTSPTSQTVSDALTNQRTLPAGSWTTITVAPARLAGTVSLTASPSLATTYSPGNGAANGTSPYGRVNSGMPPSPVADSPISAPGWFNQPWAFPADLVNSGSVSSISMGNWKVFGVSGQANANVLGFGNYQGVFNYTVNGVTGQQVGPVIPVNVVPEPGTMVLAGVGVALAAGLDYRRRQRKVEGKATA